MTSETQIQQIVRGYHEARFRGDVPAAAAHLGSEFTFSSPLLTSTDPEGHLSGLPGFLKIVTGVDLLSELYGEAEATLVYDVYTASPVGVQRTAEHFRVDDGKISSIVLIFDGTPWQELMDEVTA